MSKQTEVEINCSALSREDWLSRCATRFRKIAALDATVSMQMAESNLENIGGDLTENPEQAADDEMAEWSAD